MQGLTRVFLALQCPCALPSHGVFGRFADRQNCVVVATNAMIDDDLTKKMISHWCAAVHSRPHTALCPLFRLACQHHVQSHCICFFSGSSLEAPFCERVLPLLTVLAGAISLLLIEAVDDCFIGLPMGSDFQPARAVSHPTAVLDGQISAQPDFCVGGCGPST